MSILPLSLVSMCCSCGIIACIHSSPTCLKNINTQCYGEEKQQKADDLQTILNKLSEGSVFKCDFETFKFAPDSSVYGPGQKSITLE